MFKLKKGELGYRKRLKRQYIVLLIVLLLVIGVQLYSRSFFGKQVQTILTVTTILTALPVALLVSRLIVLSPFQPLTGEVYTEYSAYETGFPMLYELLITSTERILSMDVIAVHPAGGIYVYCTTSGVKVQQAENELNETLKEQKLNFRIWLSTDKKTFDKRIKSLKPASEYEENEQMESVISVLKEMSM